jgi:hypothetical protein
MVASKSEGHGLMQDQQIDLVDAELAGALLEAVQRLVVAVVASQLDRITQNLPPSRSA